MQGQLFGGKFLPLEIINSNSKTVITILSISSDKDTRTSKQSGLLDSTIKILLKYYTDDGMTNEITDGNSTAIVYPVNIKCFITQHFKLYRY